MRVIMRGNPVAMVGRKVMDGFTEGAAEKIHMNEEQREFIKRIILLARRFGNWQVAQCIEGYGELAATPESTARVILKQEKHK